jgi:hypothetical protein
MGRSVVIRVVLADGQILGTDPNFAEYSAWCLQGGHALRNNHCVDMVAGSMKHKHDTKYYASMGPCQRATDYISQILSCIYACWSVLTHIALIRLFMCVVVFFEVVLYVMFADVVVCCSGLISIGLPRARGCQIHRFIDDAPPCVYVILMLCAPISSSSLPRAPVL